MSNHYGNHPRSALHSTPNSHLSRQQNDFKPITLLRSPKSLPPIHPPHFPPSCPPSTPPHLPIPPPPPGHPLPNFHPQRFLHQLNIRQRIHAQMLLIAKVLLSCAWPLSPCAVLGSGRILFRSSCRGWIAVRMLWLLGVVEGRGFWRRVRVVFGGWSWG